MIKAHQERIMNLLSSVAYKNDVPVNPLRQKSTPPTWLFGGPFSDLIFTYAIVNGKFETAFKNRVKFSWKIHANMTLKLSKKLS